MATATDYYQNYLQDIVGGMMPNIRKQQRGMYDYLLGQGLRTGQPAAQIAQGMRPYAEAAGDAAAQAGVSARKMAQQQEQFDIQQANWERQFTESQRRWQEEMAQHEAEQKTANLMAMAGATGWTPQLLEALGYSDLDRRKFEMWNQRENPFYVDQGYSVQGARYNPAVARLQGSVGGYGGASTGYSTPSNPFRRVGGIGEGPGLMSLTPRHQNISSGYQGIRS